MARTTTCGVLPSQKHLPWPCKSKAPLFNNVLVLFYTLVWLILELMGDYLGSYTDQQDLKKYWLSWLGVYMDKITLCAGFHAPSGTLNCIVKNLAEL